MFGRSDPAADLGHLVETYPRRPERLFVGTSPVESVQSDVEVAVGHPEFGLVRLTIPQSGRRDLVDDMLRDADQRRDLPHLRLVEIRQGHDVLCTVPELRHVAHEVLAAVGRAHHEALLPPRDVEEDDHPAPGSYVASGKTVPGIGAQGVFENPRDRGDVYT